MYGREIVAFRGLLRRRMTGGDRVKGRPLYGTHVEFDFIGKIWLATNSLPSINNIDHGIWRRIHAIPFNHTFTAEEQDKELGSKLTKELPGILNWAIQGCLDWQEQGLNPVSYTHLTLPTSTTV